MSNKISTAFRTPSEIRPYTTLDYSSALEAYLNLLHTEAPNSQWMVAGLGVEIEPLIPIIIEKRGHIRIGLEDRPLHCTSNNIELTKNAVRIICTSGGSIASPTEVRSKLKGKPAQS